jgi:energy-coupling factor transport system ATP-binding protein
MATEQFEQGSAMLDEEQGNHPLVFSVENFSYRFPRTETRVLQDLSFTIRQGDVIGLAGESGSGKTTLLYALCGMIPHFFTGTEKDYQGHILFCGQDMRSISLLTAMHDIGLVMQDPAPQTMGMLVIDAIVFGMENRQVPKGDIELRLQQVMAQLTLDHLANRNTLSLSGGEAQATVIASRLAMQRKILFFDEVISALDSGGQERVGTIIQTLKDQGTTMVIADSDIRWLTRVTDRVFVLKEGRLVYDGPPIGVYATQKLRSMVGLPDVEKPRVFRAARESVESVVRLAQVSYAYGRTPALQNISAEVQKGSCTALLGHNGSGKSTLGKLLAGFMKPGAGSIQVEGEHISRLPAEQAIQHVGYLFQNPAKMFSEKTVRDELRLTQRYSEDEITVTLEDFGLSAFADTSPWDLSSGKQQQLALALVMAAHPTVLILDEPTSGQTRNDREKLAARITNFQDQGGTVILITHDLQLAADAADQALILQGGCLIRSGSAQDVLSDQQFFAGIGLPLPWRNEN